MRRRVLHAAWLSIAVGLALEGLLVGLAAGFGTSQGPGSIVADTLQRVSWSFVVCVGLVIGTGTARPGLGMGLLGLLAAPFGFYVARAVHKAAQGALAVTASAAAAPSPLTMALIKGLEYGILGALLGWFCVGRRGGAGMHAGVGLVTGLVFGGLVLFLGSAAASAAGTPLSTAALVARGANEVLFPVGCALVVFTARRFGESIELAENL